MILTPDGWYQVYTRPTKFKLVTPDEVCELVGWEPAGANIAQVRATALGDNRYIELMDLIILTSEGTYQ